MFRPYSGYLWTKNPGEKESYDNNYAKKLDVLESEVGVYIY